MPSLRQRIMRLEPYLKSYRAELAQATVLPPLRQRAGLLKKHFAPYHVE